ncbi:uncharacterized protein LOC131042533 isoform X2 [Cryptomeria japonica]|uniref:uncharacterized protein LOC131042533 isoform X2 n=1 Tax=Cryptomeria japonica TaxID=3369 RepID=UPI0027D9F6FD|nr:uncharacterized protein LOC131042533 isoform X2 [Cryptomeria japonica]
MQKMSDRVGYELLEVPDTPPDHLATQDCCRLRRDFGARRHRSVCFRKRGGEDEKLSREQDQAVGEKATVGSYLSPHSRGTSHRLRYSLRKDGFTQKQDHQQCTSSSSEVRPHQYLRHQSEGLPTESYMETCSNMSREDESNHTLNIDELFQTAIEEVKRNDKSTISGHAIPTPMQNRRKMLVRNGRISPNGIAADEDMSNKSVKRLREASVEGHVMNDEAADANSSISCDLDFQPNNISLPRSAQQEDRRKGKAIISGDMVESDENNCVQLLQRRKRMRANSSSSGEVNKFSVCRDSTSRWPCSSSGLAIQGKSQACRNDVSLNSSRDDASEGNIKFTRKPQGCSRVHRSERHLARLDKTRGDLPPLSSVGDQGNSSEAGSPEVVFLRSCRPLRRNPFSTSRSRNVVQESICDVEVDDRTPIDVDSLECPINETANLEESDKEASARARQIEQDELLARQLQEDFSGDELEGSVQASFGIGGRREPSHSLAIRPSLPPFLASHPTVPPHRRRDVVSGRWHRASGRPFRGSRFQFPSHMNIEMRVDMLEAMEHAVESNVTHQFLAGVQRDFNENDYEMLLALDDDNNNSKGASQRHIDRLPISTVQNDISDEVCSVCLEMPKSGEVIRHLLCMHKFHKECIDPWLAKQASCPICKLSI